MEGFVYFSWFLCIAGFVTLFYAETTEEEQDNSRVIFLWGYGLLAVAILTGIVWAVDLQIPINVYLPSAAVACAGVALGIRGIGEMIQGSRNGSGGSEVMSGCMLLIFGCLLAAAGVIAIGLMHEYQ